MSLSGCPDTDSPLKYRTSEKSEFRQIALPQHSVAFTNRMSDDNMNTCTDIDTNLKNVQDKICMSVCEHAYHKLCMCVCVHVCMSIKSV